MSVGSRRERVTQVADALGTRLATPVVAISAFLYVLGAVARYPMSMAVFEFNDAGYHMHIAQLFLENAPQLVYHAPRWRGGILMNYSSLFETTIAIVHVLTGVPLVDLWPVMTLLIWSLIPVAVFLFVRRIGNLVAGATAGTLAVYPLMLPDQGHMITAVLMALLASHFYLRILETRSLRAGLLFGVGVALVFWSHFFVLSFFAFVWAAYGVLYLALPWTGGHAYAARIQDDWYQRFDQKFTLALELVYPTVLSVFVFFVLTAEWWIDSYAEYGVHIFNSPLNSIESREVILATAHPVETGIILRNYKPIIYLAAVGSVVVFAVLSQQYLSNGLTKWHMRWIEGLSLAAVIAGIGGVLMYGYKISIVYGPVWRYYVFLFLGLSMIVGFTVGLVYSIWRYSQVRKTTKTLATLVLAIFLIGSASYGALYSLGLGLHGHSAAHLAYPGTSDRAAYEWVEDHTEADSVVVADAPDSSYLLSFSNATTVTGHYGHTNPNIDRDRAASVIFWSSNYTATERALTEFNVSYIMVDEKHPSGIFEAGLVWNDIWRGPHNDQPFQFDKYDYFGERVYHNESSGTSIYRVDHTQPPESDRGSNVSMSNRRQWETAVVGDGDQYEFRANDSLTLRYRPKSPANSEMFAQRVLQQQIQAGDDGVFVTVVANTSGDVYPHFALHYHNESDERVSTGWVDQYWRNAETYYGNGTVVYQVYFPEVEGLVDVVKVGMVQSEHQSVWRTMAVQEIRITPVNSSALSAQNDTSDARVAD